MARLREQNPYEADYGDEGDGAGLVAAPPDNGMAGEEPDNAFLAVDLPGLADSRSGETPRERPLPGGGGTGGGSIAAPPGPRVPTPHNATAMMSAGGSIGGGQPSLRTFQPMADVGAGQWQGTGGLFGQLGGLQGGGLGRPLDPMSNQQTGISDLIKMLLRK